MSNRAVDITRLKPDSIILLTTTNENNSVYEIIVFDPQNKLCYVSGGEHFKKTTEIKLLGALQKPAKKGEVGDCRVGWIEIGLPIEMVPIGTNKVITTAIVETAKIITKGYSYEL